MRLVGKVVCDTTESVAPVLAGMVCIGCCGEAFRGFRPVRVEGETIARCSRLKRRLELARPLAREDVRRAAEKPARETQYVDA